MTDFILISILLTLGLIALALRQWEREHVADSDLEDWTQYGLDLPSTTINDREQGRLL